jgi:hypothetical protein
MNEMRSHLGLGWILRRNPNTRNSLIYNDLHRLAALAIAANLRFSRILSRNSLALSDGPDHACPLPVSLG